MAVIKTQVRSGVYYDSARLMQLQRTLANLPGVDDAGVVMGTETNKELLDRVDLLSPVAINSHENDLVIVVRSDDPKVAEEAIAKVDDLLTAKGETTETAARPRTIEGAVDILPDSSWPFIGLSVRAHTEDLCGKLRWIFKRSHLKHNIDRRRVGGEDRRTRRNRLQARVLRIPALSPERVPFHIVRSEER